MSHIEMKDGQPIYWFDGRTPKKTHVGPDGVPVEQKLTAKPWRPFISPAGNVYQLDLSPAAASRNVNGAHGIQRIQRKLNAGHIPADECPMATGRLPIGLRKEGDAPCDGYVTPEGMPMQKGGQAPCTHAKRIIDARVAAHRKKSADWDRVFKKDESRILDLMMKREEREARAEAAAQAAAPAPEGTRRRP